MTTPSPRPQPGDSAETTTPASAGASRELRVFGFFGDRLVAQELLNPLLPSQSWTGRPQYEALHFCRFKVEGPQGLPATVSAAPTRQQRQPSHLREILALADDADLETETLQELKELAESLRGEEARYQEIEESKRAAVEPSRPPEAASACATPGAPAGATSQQSTELSANQKAALSSMADFTNASNLLCHYFLDLHDWKLQGACQAYYDEKEALERQSPPQYFGDVYFIVNVPGQNKPLRLIVLRERTLWDLKVLIYGKLAKPDCGFQLRHKGGPVDAALLSRPLRSVGWPLDRPIVLDVAYI